jgi:hypothetical protein
MSQLEKIIRPFTATDVFTARQLPPTQPAVAAKPPVVYTFGNAIQLLAKPIGITNLTGGVKLSEVSRKTSTVRVTNPQDNSQFVDVQRIDSLIMKDVNSLQIHQFNFNNPAAP